MSNDEKKSFNKLFAHYYRTETPFIQMELTEAINIIHDDGVLIRNQKKTNHQIKRLKKSFVWQYTCHQYRIWYHFEGEKIKYDLIFKKKQNKLDRNLLEAVEKRIKNNKLQ